MPMINPAPPPTVHTRELPTHPSGRDSHIYPPLSSLTDSFHDMMTVAKSIFANGNAAVVDLMAGGCRENGSVNFPHTDFVSL
ncbi:hypothetical protein B0T18DRAFT_410292 [Schizothecium vesticola]|uniref:Uncharacterized protein n=1 Tax=Schizothecium vesticola TaxID=314040 RepID=A0AA40EUX2_9PEZI|nr:hypothetical protein B0T18DRAFT_410292 [Schizothecium vesticola]